VSKIIRESWKCDKCGKETKDRKKADGWHELILEGYCFPPGDDKAPREWGYKNKPKDFCSKKCMTEWLAYANIILKEKGEDVEGKV
jgi:endogenous inhibitor of DNA gyrase (YacG/DUF329 family)